MGSNFGDFLKADWVERKRQNSSFSLRRFAQFLDIDPTALSRVMKGERKMTKDGVEKIAAKLGLDAGQKIRFLDEAPGHVGRPAAPRDPQASDATALGEAATRASTPEYAEIDETLNEALKHWYHSAILECAYLSDFDPEPALLAARLDISALEVSYALRTLASTGLIRMRRDGGWSEDEAFWTNIGETLTSATRRRQQKDFLAKASEAVDKVPADLRDHSSMTFAVNTARLREARELIKNFRREMNRLMQDDQGMDQVYQLCVSFFPVTRSISEAGRYKVKPRRKVK